MWHPAPHSGKQTAVRRGLPRSNGRSIAHAHAAGLGGEEGLEQPVGMIGGQTDAAIRHTRHHPACPVLA
jgi:hypothetical protein